MGALAASSDNIVIIKEFISRKHLDMAYEYCYSINDWSSWSYGKQDKISTYEHMRIHAPELFVAMQRYVDDIQELIEYRFGRKLENAHPGIRRWDVGEYQDVHADGQNKDGSPNDTFIVDYGSIMYLNDNYVGGEIYFPQHDIDFKPEQGTLIFFPSSVFYLHGVKPITEGVRYTSPHFWIPEKHRELIRLSNNE